MTNSTREIRFLSVLFGWRFFPFLFQLLFLVVFVLLVINGLGVNTHDMEFAKILRNTNLSNLVVWSYWWPAVIGGLFYWEDFGVLCVRWSLSLPG